MKRIWTEELTQAERFHEHSTSQVYPSLIPKNYNAYIESINDNSALKKQFHPSEQELAGDGLEDPIGDKNFHKAPQLIHRYENRVLLMPTTRCPINCRYCFRKNELHEKLDLFASRWQETLAYIRDHEEINEVILTGGDPLVLTTSKLKTISDDLKQIEHIKFFRIHTRTPIVLPSRIDSELVEWFKECHENFQRFHLVLHTNHIQEWNKENILLIKHLKTLSIEMLSQSVLLKGVNDSTRALEELFLFLATQGITPYYLHHPDQVKGAMHFTLSLEAGRKIYSKLRRKLPGWAVPQYVIDIPHGEGKVSAFNPESFTFSGELINRNGELVKVPLSH